MLKVWEEILSSEKNIKSPSALAVYENGDIIMGMVPWYPGQFILSGIWWWWTKWERRDIKQDYLESLARLAVIKNKYGIAHWDFQLRHILFDPFSWCTYVIDVESSWVSGNDLWIQIVKEHRKMETEVIRVSNGLLIPYKWQIPLGKKWEEIKKRVMFLLGLEEHDLRCRVYWTDVSNDPEAV